MVLTEAVEEELKKLEEQLPEDLREIPYYRDFYRNLVIIASGKSDCCDAAIENTGEEEGLVVYWCSKCHKMYGPYIKEKPSE